MCATPSCRSRCKITETAESSATRSKSRILRRAIRSSASSSISASRACRTIRHVKPHLTQAQGSGFIISSDGYVVTNNHVVENATEVNVTTDEGKTVPATVVGTDKKTDLALLKINQAGSYRMSISPPPRPAWAIGSSRSAIPSDWAER